MEDTGRSLPGGVAVAIVDLVGCDGDVGEWYLDQVQPIEPFPVRGRLGLYDVDIPAGIKRAKEPLKCPPHGWEGWEPE